MFGDKPIFGQSTVSIDAKGRIIVPKYTNREKGDNLVLLNDEEFNCYRIYNSLIIEAEINELTSLIRNAKTDDEENRYKRKRDALANMIKKQMTVDSIGRTVLGTEFTQNDKVEVIGAGNHLILKLKKECKR